MTRRIGLVGCVKGKRGSAAKAQDLYESTLFRGRRSYVEQSCDEWWILSAKHGVIHPLDVIAPYDVSLKEMGRSERRRWAQRVLQELQATSRPASGDIVEIHAGSEYRDFGLVEGLHQIGCLISIPTEGLPIGSQLRFYLSRSSDETNG